MKILVVDDDRELLNLVGFTLRQAGYLALEAADGEAALQVAAAEKPDLIVLDGSLPKLDGVEVLRRLRAQGNATPVMMLTVRAAEEDQVRALDAGADDYLTKPFSPRTLLARIRALLRRAGVERPQPLSAGELRLDIEAQSVSVRGGPPVLLTRLELRLLQFLLANAGRTLPAERLTTHVWGHRGGDREADRGMLKQLVHRVRQKIERDPAQPRYLTTVAGVGYSLDPGPQ